MVFVGNLLWFAFGGIWLGLSWVMAGLLCCCTIVGIPFGVACFRIAGFSFCPFGKKLVPTGDAGLGTAIFNILWIVFAGFWLALGSAVLGVAYCLTIIGIPWGIACFNIAQASFAPLGKKVVQNKRCSMNADELKDQAQKVVADATGVAKEATDRVRDLAKQTFTQENMAAAKDKALTAASNAKDFARKTFTKDNVRAAGKVAKEELEKLKTTEGREEAKRKAIAAWVEGKRRIVETWQGGRKGKCALIAAGTVLVLIFSSCVFSSSEDTIAGGSGGTAASRGDSAYVYDPMKMIERCQYCFYEKIRGKWEQMPPCRKGHGHSFQTIGTKGERHFGCTKCGRHYYLQYQPMGFINCPRGHACQWQEL